MRAGLAAVLGFFVAGKIRIEGKAPTEAGERLINRYMIFCLALLVISGLFKFYDGYFIQESKRLSAIRERVTSIDSRLVSKLNLESGGLACLPIPVRNQLEPMIIELCSDAKESANQAGASPLSCKEERPALQLCAL